MRTVDFPPSLSEFLSFKPNPSLGVNRKGYRADALTFSSVQESFRKPSVDQFIRQNQDLLSVIDQSAQGKQLLGERTIQTREDLKRILSEVAESSLTGESKKTLNQGVLKDKTVLSSLIILNPQNFREVINENPDLASTLAQSDVIGGNQIFEKLAEKAQALFEGDHPLADLGFLSSRPEVSSYLLSQEELVSAFKDPEQGKELARQFKSQVDSATYQALFEGHLSQMAASAVGSAQLNTEFFSENIEIAKYVVGSERSGQSSTLARLLGDKPELVLGEPGNGNHSNIFNVLNELVIKNSKNTLSFNSSLQKFDFANEGGLALALTESSEVRAALNSREGEVALQRLFAPQSVSTQTLDLVRSHYQAEVPANFAFIF